MLLDVHCFLNQGTEHQQKQTNVHCILSQGTEHQQMLMNVHCFSSQGTEHQQMKTNVHCMLRIQIRNKNSLEIIATKRLFSD